MKPESPKTSGRTLAFGETTTRPDQTVNWIEAAVGDDSKRLRRGNVLGTDTWTVLHDVAARNAIDGAFTRGEAVHLHGASFWSVLPEAIRTALKP